VDPYHYHFSTLIIMKFTITSTLFTLACGAAFASALPAIESEDLSIRAPAPGAITVDGFSLDEREPLFFGAALKVGLKMGARVYSNWRNNRRKRDLEDLEERDLDLDAREAADLGAFIDMIERSFSDEGLGGSDVDARDVSEEFEDVLERDFEALEDTD
jgi:hypothetical protein